MKNRLFCPLCSKVFALKFANGDLVKYGRCVNCRTLRLLTNDSVTVIGLQCESPLSHSLLKVLSRTADVSITSSYQKSVLHDMRIAKSIELKLKNFLICLSGNPEQRASPLVELPNPLPIRPLLQCPDTFKSVGEKCYSIVDRPVGQGTFLGWWSPVTDLRVLQGNSI